MTYWSTIRTGLCIKLRFRAMSETWSWVNRKYRIHTNFVISLEFPLHRTYVTVRARYIKTLSIDLQEGIYTVHFTSFVFSIREPNHTYSSFKRSGDIPSNHSFNKYAIVRTSVDQRWSVMNFKQIFSKKCFVLPIKCIYISMTYKWSDTEIFSQQSEDTISQENFLETLFWN